MSRIRVAIGVVTRGNQILICQRKEGKALGGLWEFPGGKCEPEESAEACLFRELMEEVAIEVRTIKPLTPVQHDYPHGKVTLFPFLCQHYAGEPKPLECQKAIWVMPEELKDYEFPAGNRALLEEVSLEMRARKRASKVSD
jgi:8-oxo-dGTP diphosphatase